MRLIPLVTLTAALLGLTLNEDRGGLNGEPVSRPQATQESPCLMAETQPASRPAKTTSVDDEIKALNLKNMNLGSAMKQMQSLKIEDKLRSWSATDCSDFADARKTGAHLAGMAKMIDWKKCRKRNKDSKAFDQLATDLETAARKIAEAAGKKDPAEVKAACDAANQSCSACHSKFNSK